jgi:hypothetical protein
MNPFNLTGKTFPLLEKEDEFVKCVCRNINQSYDQNNQYVFRNNIDVPEYYKKNKMFEQETTLIFPDETKLCDKNIVKYRGQNNIVSSSGKKKEFLVQPCPHNTYANHLVCDGKKCCSRNHQLFMNYTKQNTGSIWNRS